MTVFEGFWRLYRGLGTFILKAWWVLLLLAVPALSRTAYADDWVIWQSLPLMAVWAVFCTLLQLGGIYILLRFFALDGDVNRAVAVTRASIRTFIPFGLVWTALSLVGLALTEFIPAYPNARWASDVLVGILIIWLSPWAVTSPSGQQTVAPMASFEAVFPHTIWAILFMLLAWLPISLAETGLFFLISDEASRGGADLQGVSILVLVSIAKWLVSIGSMYVIAIKAGLRIAPPKGAAGGAELA